MSRVNRQLPYVFNSLIMRESNKRVKNIQEEAGLTNQKKKDYKNGLRLGKDSQHDSNKKAKANYY